jgi:tetratricopeptide (TPR) repeat protein
LRGDFLVARAREALGDVAGAERAYHDALPMEVQAQVERPSDGRPLGMLALIYAGLGRRDEALAAARRSLELLLTETNPGQAAGGSSFDREAGYAALAQVQARFGMTEEALAIVQAQADAGWWRRNYLLISEDWRDLRKDPRFRDIAEKAPL